MEPKGGSFDEFPPVCRTAWCGGLSWMVGETGGLGYVFQIATVDGLSLPGSYGSSLARIVSDNWGFLSRCLFDERRVEFEFSSCGT